jgi:predicted TPR repeat methyltransferase
VVERLVLDDDRRFDLMIGTNVFVYYSPFEQGLAAANVASMLKPGGVLLSNNDIVVTAPMKSAVGYLPIAYSDRQNDHVFSYQRE